MSPTQNRRPWEGAGKVEAAATTGVTVADCADTHEAAREWVCWTARRRWPDHPANDELWAACVAAWWLGGTVRRG